MSTHDSVPLPEIHASTEDFPRAWTRFELVDYYTDLPADTRGDLKLLKAALEEKAGITPDQFSAASSFNRRSQGPDERSSDFAMALGKLFKVAYLRKPQSYCNGLSPVSAHQLAANCSCVSTQLTFGRNS